MNQLNQFHAPSFGDDMFDMPTEPPNHASQRMLSLDHSTFNDADEEDGNDNTYGGEHSSMMTQQHEQPENQQQQQTQLPPAAQQQQQVVPQAPPKPLAPFALFFHDTVKAIKQQNPACSLEQISVIVQTMWDSLDETQKNVYMQKHEQEKHEYVRRVRDYRQQLLAIEVTPMEASASVPEASVPADLITPNIEMSGEQTTAVATATPTEAPPEQIQLLTEAAQAPKCTREQCNKPAIINPDWEDEYCSNECVVIHCRNVFNDWALSLKNSPT